ncbi:hypothetical protein LguiA_023548 [Lonicera macranthoides]
MNRSHPLVHPIDAPPPPLTVTDGDPENLPPPRLRMKDVRSRQARNQAWPRLAYLVAAVSLQSLRSFLVAIVNRYALLVKRCLRNSRVVCFFVIEDGFSDEADISPHFNSTGMDISSSFESYFHAQPLWNV